MKKWETLSKFKTQNTNFDVDELIDVLLGNRGISTKQGREVFLNPRLENITPKNVDIDLKQLKKALTRIKKAVDTKEQIVVFGDYDVDGVTASAIIWETLHELGAMVLPYIPHRVEEGYGLSEVGISNLQNQISNVQLIITVDNGIVANDAVTFANKQGIDVIITDHHAVGEYLPKAHAIVHTTRLCGAGVAWILAQEIKKEYAKVENNKQEDKHLELAALGTIADLVPLTDANRAIVTFGLQKLSTTNRVGLQELLRGAGLEKELLSVYDVGYIISPRLNAAGRIESAMDSLRLLCTRDRNRARMLALQLESINLERQVLMRQAAGHAIESINNQEVKIKNLLFVAHETYKEGIIGLVAGKLVEEFYRPSIVISIGEKNSKGSVRSVRGFNVIEFLRTKSEHFLSLGGHPMAAGFTIQTEKIIILQELLEKMSESLLDQTLLTRSIKVDCELSLPVINKQLYKYLQTLAPFGMSNPEPVFVSRGVTIDDVKKMGKDGSHLRLKLRQDTVSLEAVAFKMGELATDLHVGDAIDVVYTIDENTWNGNTKLQLKVKDIR